MYNYELYEYDYSCKRIGGPPLPSVDECDSPGNEECVVRKSK